MLTHTHIFFLYYLKVSYIHHGRKYFSMNLLIGIFSYITMVLLSNSVYLTLAWYFYLSYLSYVSSVNWHNNLFYSTSPFQNRSSLGQSIAFSCHVSLASLVLEHFHSFCLLWHWRLWKIRFPTLSKNENVHFRLVWSFLVVRFTLLDLGWKVHRWCCSLHRYPIYSICCHCPSVEMLILPTRVKGRSISPLYNYCLFTSLGTNKQSLGRF